MKLLSTILLLLINSIAYTQCYDVSSQYKEYAVPVFAQKILEDENQLNNLLHIKFGTYYVGLIE